MRRFPRTRLSALSLLVCSACNQGLEDPRFATGSQSIVASEDGTRVYVANADEGTVSAVDVATGDVHELAVGIEPTRVARIGDRILATVRGERGIAVLRDDGGSLVVDRRLDTGVEPVGIVASEDGTRFFVAASLSGQVEVWDAVSWTRTASFQVPGEPRWLALHPGGRALYVGSHVGGRLSVIDLEENTVAAVILPDRETFPVSAINLDVAVNEETGGVAMPRRITGDLAISPDGDSLAVPLLHVDNINGEDTAPEDGSGFYGSSGRFNPGVVVIDLASSGLPTDTVRLLDPTGFDLDGSRLGSVISSVSWTPDGKGIVVPMEGARSVAFIDTAPTQNGGQPSFGEPGGSGSVMNPEFVTVRLVDVDQGPRGVAFTTEGDAFVQAFLDRSVGVLPVEDATEGFGENSPALGGLSPMADTAIVGVGMGTLPSETFAVVAESKLTFQQEAGRTLFFTARDPSVSDPFSGLSCGTCHAGGRADGITWPLFEGQRQTPSLAGGISATAPYTWNGDVATVAHEAMLTSQGRMGGTGLTPADAAAVEAFIEVLRTPDAPGRGEAEPELELGREIFFREDVGCGSCHSGDLFTDNEPYDMFGLIGVGTRALNGILASAPYLHDGSAPDLRAVLILSADGEMGDTGMLDDGEFEALLAYVSSL